MIAGVLLVSAAALLAVSCARWGGTTEGGDDVLADGEAGPDGEAGEDAAGEDNGGGTKDGTGEGDGDTTVAGDTCGDGECVDAPTVDCPAGDWFEVDGLCFMCNGDGDGVKGEGIPMDDGNDCTEDKCDHGNAVEHEPLETGPCDDGNPDTIWDHCVDGVCVTTEPVDCPAGDWFEMDGLCFLCNGDGDGIKGQGEQIDDSNVCTLDECDAGNGVDHYDANGMPCDDGNPDTSGDICKGGICVGS